MADFCRYAFVLSARHTLSCAKSTPDPQLAVTNYCYNRLVQPVALALAFLLELIAFAFFAATPFTFQINRSPQALAAAVLLVLILGFWGRYMAPKASKRFGLPTYDLCKVWLYTVSAYSILSLIGTPYFVAFVAAALLDESMLFTHNLRTYR